MNFREFIPKFLVRRYIGLVGGWHGNYKSWEDAKKRASGYENDDILKKVKESLLKVKSGEAVYERDSVLFDKVEYSYPLLSSLLFVATQNNSTLNLLDFGGSLGSTYFQNLKFLNRLNSVKWNIVEQKSFVECGKKHFEDDRLKFYHTIADCLMENKVDIVLFGSVLQYLEKPYDIIDQIINLGIKYIIIDRTPFIDKNSDRITVQRVPKNIYKASYPCWYFSRKKFESKIQKEYDIFFDCNSDDISNIDNANFKGYLFVKKEH